MGALDLRRTVARLLAAGALATPVPVAAADGPNGNPGALQDGAQSFAGNAEATAKSEIIKRELAMLVQTARLSNPETAEEAAKEIGEAVDQLAMDAKKTQEFFERLKRMDRAELKSWPPQQRRLSSSRSAQSKPSPAATTRYVPIGEVTERAPTTPQHAIWPLTPSAQV